MFKATIVISLTCFLTLTSTYLLADAEIAKANKALTIEFYTEVILKGNAEAIDDYIGDTYIQHNPRVADGKAALKELVSGFPKATDDSNLPGEIVRAIAEDNLVVLHVKHHSWPGPNGGAFVDIFRVEDGLIVEHWDVIQAIPDTSANQNTMF